MRLLWTCCRDSTQQSANRLGCHPKLWLAVLSLTDDLFEDFSMQSFRSTLHVGVHYKKTFPVTHPLTAFWPERRVIRWTNLAEQLMPAIAAIGLTVQLQFNGLDFLPLALVQALFVLSLPVQAWYWLGNRAKSPLPPPVQSVYDDYAKRLTAMGVQVPTSSGQRNYQQFAELLLLVQRQLGNAE